VQSFARQLTDAEAKMVGLREGRSDQIKGDFLDVYSVTSIHFDPDYFLDEIF
jgi:hypothetical protein